MSKYIIELDDRIKLVTSVGVTENGVVYTTSDYVHNLEELNSDYINEHYGQLQDEAYQRGYKDCETRYCSFDACPNRQAEYQRGLDDAWEAARKIVDMWDRIDNDELLAIFGITERIGYSTIIALFGKQTASEALEKLKAYEEKQNDKIVVGNEVLWFMKGDDEGCDDIMDVCAPSVVTMVPNKECDDYTIIESSGAMTVISKEQIYKKTGRHFDIASILEDMKK